MAKKKRKRRSQGTVPITPPAPAQSKARGVRADRKELARQEREAMMRRMRRRQRTRRLILWGTIVLVIAAAVGYWFWQRSEEEKQDEAITQLAARVGCQPWQEDLPDEGAGHLETGEPAPPYSQVPATSGRHSQGTLPPDIAVYDDPVPEEQGVHNLEHGYVIMYYSAEELDEDVLDALTSVAESQDEVILAPYTNLPDGEDLAFVAWNNAQHCSLNDDAAAADVAEVAEGFIGKFKNSGDAPEAGVG